MFTCLIFNWLDVYIYDPETLYMNFPWEKNDVQELIRGSITDNREKSWEQPKNPKLRPNNKL